MRDGVQPLLHLAGAAAMRGVTGTFLDWNHNKAALTKRRPAPLEVYPSQRAWMGWGAPAMAASTADAAQRAALFDATARLGRELRAKHGFAASAADAAAQ